MLGASIKQYHPDWNLWLLVSDRAPEGFSLDIENEPWDRLVYITELPISNIEGWMFKHDVVELCTAVKGPFLEELLKTNAEKIFYLDPDIAVLNSLEPMLKLLDEHSILLTPHQLEPDDEPQSVWDNEICSLAHGIYNLGFIAIRNDDVGKDCVRWWSKRCKSFCYDAKDKGLFVDQKWCDLIPAFFERVHILRDPGYNIASWNLNRRKITASKDGQFVVNGEFPIRFYHFTKLGPIGDTMTRRYAGDNTEVYELWAWYKRCIAEATDDRIPDRWWHYGVYSSGSQIPKDARVLYRDREDLIDHFPNPFDSSNGGYEAWYNNEIQQ
ncbi:hypothetical protein [Salaquimonas pukyongi]|uniref:hypothetical protein n=1 Tax=Salaquimonas pukyongi TaxID=2712698 RepID=UPI001FCD607F|nr:hypothetical protein [Salaquimonas pukyongi]